MSTAKKPAKTTKKASPAKSAAAFILLDRSGSMKPLWEEALGAVNTYATALGKSLPKAAITLAVFDSGNKFEIIRDKVMADAWADATSNDAQPRGTTPLYDAVSMLCGHAAAHAAEKTTLVVMTDGQENASAETTKATAKAALDAARAKGWDVLFLGANWDAMSQAADVGTNFGHTMNAAKGRMKDSMTAISTRTANYSSGVLSASANFTEADRKASGWKK